MLINQAMEKLAQMKLEGFLDGLREQMGSPTFGDMPFEDRLGLLVDREYTLRENRRLTRHRHFFKKNSCNILRVFKRNFFLFFGKTQDEMCHRNVKGNGTKN